MPFEENIFINCPFDKEYVELLRPMLFTLIYSGLNPRIASEQLDSSEIRIDKIVGLIEESKYSIHDLSRMRSTKKNEIARFNMPFELGIDYACKKFKSGKWQEKKILIVEKDRHEYKKAISDLSGCDIKQHSNDPYELVLAIRNWIREAIKKDIENASIISDQFNTFMIDFLEKRQKEGYKDKDLEIMPTIEFIDFIREWVRAHK